VGGAGYLSAVVITRDAPSAVGGLAAVLERFSVNLLLAPPDAMADAAPWIVAAQAQGVRVEALRPGLILGNDLAHLAFAPPSRHGDRWSAMVKHAEHRITLTGTGGDAGIERERGNVGVSIVTVDVRLHARLASGESARLVSDGSRIRMHLARGRTAELSRAGGPSASP
jgi:hypothetical protein